MILWSRGWCKDSSMSSKQRACAHFPETGESKHWTLHQPKRTSPQLPSVVCHSEPPQRRLHRARWRQRALPASCFLSGLRRQTAARAARQSRTRGLGEGTVRTAEAGEGTIASDAELRGLFDLIDTDESGFVSFDEFSVFAEYCGVRSSGCPTGLAELRFVFDEADAGKTGKISMSEMGSILQRIGLLEGGTDIVGVTRTCTERPETRCSGIHVEQLVRRARQGWEACKQCSCDTCNGLRMLQRQSLLAWRLVKSSHADPLTENQRGIVLRALLDLVKLVPFLLIILVLPGGSALSMFLLQNCPWAVPSAFARAKHGTARTSNGDTSINEFDELCMRTFAAFVREARARSSST